MKKFIVVSSLFYTLIMTVTEWILSEYAGYTTFKSFNCFAVEGFISIQCLLFLALQGIVFGSAAAIYIKPKSANVDGFRFGLIAGLVVVLLTLSNMMLQINDQMYAFLAAELLPVVGLMIMGFMLLGCVVGFLFKLVTSSELNQKPFAYHV